MMSDPVRGELAQFGKFLIGPFARVDAAVELFTNVVGYDYAGTRCQPGQPGVASHTRNLFTRSNGERGAAQQLGNRRQVPRGCKFTQRSSTIGIGPVAPPRTMGEGENEHEEEP